MFGAERQFHHQASYLCDLVVTVLLNYRDRAWRSQRDGLVELISRFFRRKSSNPALIWAAPIWMRTAVWARREGLVMIDETDGVRSRGVTSAFSNYHRLRFAGGESVKVNVKELQFFYPRSSTTLLHVPRYRKLYTPAKRLVGLGYEEGLGLGAQNEKKALEEGNYTPNKLFFRRKLGLEWLELMTVTFASFIPDPPPEDDITASGIRDSWRLGRRRFPSRLANEFSSLLGNSSQKDLPAAATVRFLRLTFHPEDFKIVVLLAAERDLPRFIAEHDGLAQLLIERLTAERMQT